MSAGCTDLPENKRISAARANAASEYGMASSTAIIITHLSERLILQALTAKIKSNPEAASSAQKSTGPAEYAVQHESSQPAGLCVLLARKAFPLLLQTLSYEFQILDRGFLAASARSMRDPI
jgi:hypothetical protein